MVGEFVFGPSTGPVVASSSKLFGGYSASNYKVMRWFLFSETQSQ